MPEIDLRSRSISPQHNVYFVRPGKNYHLYQPFVHSEAIIADLPFLELQRGVALEEQASVINRIHRSRAIRNWYRGDRENAFPSRDLSVYPDNVRDLGISQLKSVVERYFSEAKKGDLVLVIPGSITSDAYIGELTGEPSDIITLSYEYVYNNEPLQGRKVKWLATTKKNLWPILY
ncbi:hypothetical protein [Methylobacterium radiodurans]|uniref:hypothetical protein n=1 Tax=Methylobacterium radiodurans TaxID=2202828 RepID=UPI001950BCE9|nr:hypothetical protein [Methylobacterium radiodurans]